MKRALARYMLAASLAMLTLNAAEAGPVTTDDLLRAQDNASEWLMYGRDYRNWRYSPLQEITPGRRLSDVSHGRHDRPSARH